MKEDDPGVMVKGADFAAAVTRGLTEKAWSAHVEQLLKVFGWRFYHSWISVRSPSGYPDYICFRIDPNGVGRLLAIELKSERGKLTPAQEEWLGYFARVPGCEAYCLRPSDRERLVAILQGRETP